jgi:hypothetical protein
VTDNLQPSTDPKVKEPGRFKIWLDSFLTLRAAEIQLYRLCDDFSGALIFLMIIFSPWAFGTTQMWSIWTMNVAGYALGVLLLAKLFIRGAKGYPAPRWENFFARSGTNLRHRRSMTRGLTHALAGLTLAVLAFCLISAVNAAAIYDSETRVFQYHHHLGWLPHSFDGHRTWFYLAMYLGLAAAFWSVWDWLLGLTPDEERVLRGTVKNDSGKTLPLPPPRAIVPVTSVPMKFPWMLLETLSSSMFWTGKWFMATPRSVLEPTTNRRPAFPLAAAPLISMTGLPANPGCVVASIITGEVIAGSTDASVIVNGGVPLIWKTIELVPEFALAFRMACRNEPAPLSAALVTVKVDAKLDTAKPQTNMTEKNLPCQPWTNENLTAPCLN